MIRHTLFLYTIITGCSLFSCARTNLDIHGFTLIEKNINLENNALTLLQASIINCEMQKIHLMEMLNKKCLAPQNYFNRTRALNEKININKEKQNELALLKDDALAQSIKKKYIQSTTTAPVFDRIEINKLKNTYQTVTRGLILLQHIANNEQQTLAQLQQAGRPANQRHRYKSTKSMYTDINK